MRLAAPPPWEQYTELPGNHLFIYYCYTQQSQKARAAVGWEHLTTHPPLKGRVACNLFGNLRDSPIFFDIPLVHHPVAEALDSVAIVAGENDVAAEKATAFPNFISALK
eukprot:941470-Prorocentrum_minimum.AAC.1